MSKPPELLEGIESSQSVPAVSHELQQLVQSMQPVTPIRPMRHWMKTQVIVWITLLVYIVALKLRIDWHELPRWWQVLGGASWTLLSLLTFLSLLIPSDKSVQPEFSRSVKLSVVSVLILALVGGVFSVSVPQSIVTLNSPVRFIGIGIVCLVQICVMGQWFAWSAIRPFFGGIPSHGGALAFASGTVGGIAAGIGLHLHCAVGEGLHIAIFHAGSALVSGWISLRWLPKKLWQSSQQHTR